MQQNGLLNCLTFYSFTEHVAVNSQEYPQHYSTAPQFTVLTRILLDYEQSFFRLIARRTRLGRKKMVAVFIRLTHDESKPETTRSAESRENEDPLIYSW